MYLPLKGSILSEICCSLLAVFLFCDTAKTTEPDVPLELDEPAFLGELFEFQVAFSLEQEDTTLFDMPRFVLMTENGYFVADDNGQTLYRFHADGSFDRIVAVKGAGPEEIQRVCFATRMFDGQVGVFDFLRGRILVFSEAGDYLWALDTRHLQIGAQSVQFVGGGFAWPHRETLFLSNLMVPGRPDTQAAWTRATWVKPDRVDSLAPVQWLNSRPRALEAQFGSGLVDHLVVVGDHVWLANRFLPHIDMVGEASTRTTRVRVPNVLTEEDYRGLTIDDNRTLMELDNLRGTIHCMLVFDRLVLVKIGALGWVVLDHQGRQLVSRKIRARIGRFFDARGDTAVIVTLRRHFEQWQAPFGAAVAVSSDHDTPDPEQSMVVLLRLKGAFR